MERSLANKLLIEDALLNLNSQNGFGRFIEERGKRDEDFMREKPIVTDVEDWSQLIQPSAKLDTVLHRDGKGTHVYVPQFAARIYIINLLQISGASATKTARPVLVPASKTERRGSDSCWCALLCCCGMGLVHDDAGGACLLFSANKGGFSTQTHEKILQASEQFRIEKLNRQYVKSVKRTQG